MNPFFSIIIPVYNVEKYLEQCLDSILSQDYSSYEIICINDGSTDQSSEILKKYNSKHSNIKVKTIQNSGTSVARNEGIKMAIGQYILFIDSDDWIEKNSLECIYHYLNSDPVDILSFNGSLYYEKNQKVEIDTGERINSLSGWEYYNKTVFRPKKFHFVCVVIKAYKRLFLINNHLYFHPGLLHEDNLFTPLVFYHATSTAEIPDRLYYYRIHEGSKMQEYTYKQIEDKCNVNNILANLFLNKTELSVNNISRIIASDYISFYGGKVKSAIGEKQQEITAMISKDLFKRSCVSGRHKFLYLLIMLHPGIYRLYMKFTKIFR